MFIVFSTASGQPLTIAFLTILTSKTLGDCFLATADQPPLIADSKLLVTVFLAVVSYDQLLVTILLQPLLVDL